ncbi:MAG: type II CAAX endopeptidase family protein [Bacteroidota bacterium]|nr:type II CAAX endopeptidase family protein [Bacteroidota bacterium]
MALHNHSVKVSEKGMKVLRFPLTRLVIAASILFVGSALAALIVEGFLMSFGKEGYDQIKPILTPLFQIGFALLGYWIFVSLFDGRSTTELSTGFFKQSGLGILLGFGFISLVMGILALLGYYRIDGQNPDSAILQIFLMSLMAGIVEEIFMRGYFFRIVEEGLGTWWSVIFSALLFGFLHAWNPNASFISSISIALTAGVVLALLYAITRNLWIVIGMHFAWNFTLGGIYGAPVSGSDAKGFFNGILEGPEWLTGGDFGPEASLITMVVFSLFGIYLIFKTIQVKQVKLPMWRKSK